MVNVGLARMGVISQLYLEVLVSLRMRRIGFASQPITRRAIVDFPSRLACYDPTGPVSVSNIETSHPTAGCDAQKESTES